jgi:hypothetical protein
MAKWVECIFGGSVDMRGAQWPVGQVSPIRNCKVADRYVGAERCGKCPVPKLVRLALYVHSLPHAAKTHERALADQALAALEALTHE